jgi:hypothetical protein
MVSPEQCQRITESFINVLLLAVRSEQELSEQDADDLLVVAGSVDQFRKLVEGEAEGEIARFNLTDDTIGEFSSVRDYVESLVMLRSVEALN